MSLEEKETYFVAVKLFLERDGKLFIFKDRFGDWDLPGGRIRKDEFEKPLAQVIERKIAEELGPGVKCEVGMPLVLMRHERKEAETPGNPAIRIFAIGYAADWKAGEVKLSSLHTEMQWVDPADFRPEDYFTGGWLQGVREYLALRRKKER